MKQKNENWQPKEITDDRVDITVDDLQEIARDMLGRGVPATRRVKSENREPTMDELGERYRIAPRE